MPKPTLLAACRLAARQRNATNLHKHSGRPSTSTNTPRRQLAAPAAHATNADSTSTRESQNLRRAGALVFSAATAYTAHLSYWQYSRRAWKEDLIEQRTAKLHGSPRPIAEALGAPPGAASVVTPELEHTQVTLEGVYDHAEQVALGPRSAPPGTPKPKSLPAGAPGSSGWDIVTPLRLADGTSVLINRGWVPRELIAQVSQPAGPQRLRGVLMPGEKGNRFTVNTPERRQFSYLDAAALAAATKSSPVVVYAVVDDGGAARAPDPPGVAPLARELSSFLNFYVEPWTHLAYSATWATLSAVGGVITYARFLR